jgi:hypothetical protein
MFDWTICKARFTIACPLENRVAESRNEPALDLKTTISNEGFAALRLPRNPINPLQFNMRGTFR